MPQKSIFLFFGEDTYTRHKKLETWKKQFVQKYQSAVNVETLKGKSLEANKFLTDIDTLPFMSEKRLIIIKNFLEKGKKPEQEKIAEGIKNAPDFCVLIFQEEKKPDRRSKLFKAIAKIGNVQEFHNPKPAELNTWILDQAKRRKIQMSFAQANYLSQYCENNLWTLSNELDKLKNYANGQPITQTMIEHVTTPSLSTSIFKLTDSIATKNKKMSLKHLAILQESGEDVGRIFHMIARHFRIMIQTKELSQKGNSQNEIAKTLKQHPFTIQKTINQSRNFTQPEITKIFAKLLEIDINSKTGIIRSHGSNNDFSLALEKLIINLCKAH